MSDTVRGRIREFLLSAKPLMRSPVLEIGSRRDSAGDWWADNHWLLPDREWLGIDLREGPGVDRIMNAEKLDLPDNHFGTVLCSEMLEHSWRPWAVIGEAFRVLRPHGVIVLTTLFSFPVHAWPDYWRFTPDCIRRLLAEAGFEARTISTAGESPFPFDDHGIGACTFHLPTHVFAHGVKPC